MDQARDNEAGSGAENGEQGEVNGANATGMSMEVMWRHLQHYPPPTMRLFWHMAAPELTRCQLLGHTALYAALHDTVFDHIQMLVDERGMKGAGPRGSPPADRMFIANIISYCFPSSVVSLLWQNVGTTQAFQHFYETFLLFCCVWDDDNSKGIKLNSYLKFWRDNLRRVQGDWNIPSVISAMNAGETIGDILACMNNFNCFTFVIDDYVWCALLRCLADLAPTHYSSLDDFLRSLYESKKSSFRDLKNADVEAQHQGYFLTLVVHELERLSQKRVVPLLPDSPDDVFDMMRHWLDMCRWSLAAETLNRFSSTLSSANRPEIVAKMIHLRECCPRRRWKFMVTAAEQLKLKNASMWLGRLGDQNG